MFSIFIVLVVFAPILAYQKDFYIPVEGGGVAVKET
jgi:hypothetical protein